MYIQDGSRIQKRETHKLLDLCEKFSNLANAVTIDNKARAELPMDRTYCTPNEVSECGKLSSLASRRSSIVPLTVQNQRSCNELADNIVDMSA